MNSSNPDGTTGFGTGIVANGDYGSNLGVAPGLATTVTGSVTGSPRPARQSGGSARRLLESWA